MGRLTSTDLRAVTLGRPGWGRKGYRPEEVDAFLIRAAEALDALAMRRVPSLTADEVREVVFRRPGFGKGRGYDEDQVDELLDAVESALRADPARTQLDGRPLGS